MPLPPGLYRAEHIGSLLRPTALKSARQSCAQGRISMQELKEVEDDLIRDVVEKQLRYGLRSITDGEFRRAYFHLDFLKKVDGVDTVEVSSTNGAIKSKDGFTPPTLVVKGKLRHVNDIQVADFGFLRDTLRSSMDRAGILATTKVSIPSPTMVHFRGGRASIDIEAYPQLEPDFFDDLARVYQEELAALYRAGARFVQLDDTNLAYLCDQDMRKAAIDRGHDPNLLPKRYAVRFHDLSRRC
jgi:5-methyltetrahydropteroyltriglutamate--homocysteine methyltransferase